MRTHNTKKRVRRSATLSGTSVANGTIEASVPFNAISAHRV